MTIVVAISSHFHALVVADSRLTYRGEGSNPNLYRDVCQKLIAANSWSLVGFSGDLCLARDLLAHTVGRLQQTLPPDWVRRDELIGAHFEFFIRQHARRHRRDRARDHEKEQAEFLIVWMDHSRSIVGGQRPGDGLWHPGAEIIKVKTSPLTVSRTPFGIDVIGSGSRITEDLNGEFLSMLNFGSQSRHGAYMASYIVDDLLKQNGIPTVGGLYQLAVLTAPGVEWVPYFYWVDVETGYGTYVAMRLEAGHWVQEHRPTSTKIRIASPFDITLDGGDVRPNQNEMFNPRGFTRHTPGVIPTKNPIELFHVYDAESYAQDPLACDIRDSWGDEPEPMSFDS